MRTEEIKAEQLKGEETIKRELDQTGEKKRTSKIDRSEKLRLTTYIVAIAAFGGVFYVSRFGYFAFAGQYEPLLQRLTIGVLAITLLLLILRAAKAYLIFPLQDAVARYNLERVANLLAGLAIFFIAISILFANWYTAVVSFGLISLILGFALQTPITSFIGWIYILVRVPYRVGDRITIGQATGDVIALSYLDTTLWEVGGPMLSTVNHPSGRIIKFPNSKVLDEPVHNYSWALFPYIWNDISFQVAYQSDLEFVTNVLTEVANEEVGEHMSERVKTYRELLAETPVDQFEVHEHPVVVFRIGENTWVTAIIRYLVEPRMAGPVKTRMIKKMLDRLNAEPDKVMFPKGNMR
ncbi:MAG: mechanosensitive ion channel family protein [Pyrinomonadaceae bacterium]